MQQRYYDPQIGRFLSVDPVTANPANGSNFNRYKYAANNPYRFTDPDGRMDKETRRELAADRRSMRAHPSLAGSVRTVGGPAIGGSAGGQRIPGAKESSKVATGTPAQGGASDSWSEKPKPSVSATGVAALGVGFEVSKGLVNAGDTVSLVTPALGLEAKIDGELPLAQFNFRANPVDTPVTMGFQVSGHLIGGIGLKGTFDPGGTGQLSLTGGLGLGASFQFYSIGAEIRKSGE